MSLDICDKILRLQLFSDKIYYSSQHIKKLLFHIFQIFVEENTHIAKIILCYRQSILLVSRVFRIILTI